MPKIGTKVQEAADDVAIGVEYEIANVSEVDTEISHYKGIRVELLSKKGDEGSVMLWQRPVTSPKSKLGAFIDLLGDDTDKWLHKSVKFTDWRIGARIIELIK